MSADASELLLYVGHVGSTVDRAEPELKKIVERGALNVKRGAVRNLHGLHRTRFRHLNHYPRSITYDLLGPLEAEIGPDSSLPQGGMGRGVELGSVHTPPMPHLFPAADAEEPRLQANALRAWTKACR